MSTFNKQDAAVVLVVEDEILIREDVIDVLEQDGFVALRAGTVGEALDVLTRRCDVRAVFTDIQMPGGLDGLDLARHVTDERPGLPVLVTSGRARAPEALPPASRFIPKPYLPDTVARVLREMMAGRVDDDGWTPGFGSPPTPHA
ncbi:MAG: response regulator [Bauldia sp.]|nr:response regulator [Bauldia sp.]